MRNNLAQKRDHQMLKGHMIKTLTDILVDNSNDFGDLDKNMVDKLVELTPHQNRSHTQVHMYNGLNCSHKNVFYFSPNFYNPVNLYGNVIYRY